MSAGNDTIKAKVKADLGIDAGDLDFMSFKDLSLTESVLEDVGIVRRSPLLDPELPVHGYIYDVSHDPSPLPDSCKAPPTQPAAALLVGTCVSHHPVLRRLILAGSKPSTCSATAVTLAPVHLEACVDSSFVQRLHCVHMVILVIIE